jgi:hypothetical protein
MVQACCRPLGVGLDHVWQRAAHCMQQKTAEEEANTGSEVGKLREQHGRGLGEQLAAYSTPWAAKNSREHKSF